MNVSEIIHQIDAVILLNNIRSNRRDKINKYENDNKNAKFMNMKHAKQVVRQGIFIEQRQITMIWAASFEIYALAVLQVV